jgi:leucyl aminopeptidase
MVTITLSHKQLYDHPAQGYVIFCEQDFAIETYPVAELKKLYPPLEVLMAQRNFLGRKNSSFVFAGTLDGQPAYGMMFGLGSINKKQEDRIESYRRALGNVIRNAESLHISQLCIILPDPAWFESDAFTLGKETQLILEMASYHFNQFITEADRKLNQDYVVTLVAHEMFHEQLKIGIEQGTRIGYAVNQARLWCDLPPRTLTPIALAEHAQRIAQAHSLKATIFTEADIIKMGMGGLQAVSQGSEQECRLVIMEYKSKHTNAPTIALVGKGITFDSGGLSLKPAVHMETMKDDMAGAATVISTMEAIAHLQPNINVIGIAPLSENMPSGSAIKPGDIIQFYNGKTAEVKNTDAEGRLILADALSYAVAHYKLDAIIDIATLTGACAHALGPFYCGLVSKNDDLIARILEAGFTSGDRAWQLPFDDDYKVAIKSDVADLCNIGTDKYKAGAITAGFFLQNFVDNVPWAHLDIAGTAFNVPDKSYYRPGATGFGVRLFIQMLMNWPLYTSAK